MAPCAPKVKLTRHTIAILVDHIDNLVGGYEGLLRRAFQTRCEELGLNLFIVVGRSLGMPDVRGATHNQIYRHVTPESVDGAILISAGLAAFCGAEGLQQLVHAYPGLPRVSVGLRVPGVPSVVVDNRPGMDALLDHLFEHHGCRRVAFLGGPERNPDAIVRFDAYRRALVRHGIEFDAALVENASFTPATGAQALREILKRVPCFDALVAANDGMALGAIEVLRAHGMNIPADVLVTGFDDLEGARVAIPPLTTVRQPLERMAALAVDLLAEQIAGRSVPEAVELPVEFVARHSCGCEPGSGAEILSSPSVCDAADFVRRERARLATLVERNLRGAKERAADTALDIVRALEAELDGADGAFVLGIDAALGRLTDHHERYEDVQDLITVLRAELRSRSDARMADMWDSARRAVALANKRDQTRGRAELENAYLRLLQTADQFSTSLDADGLRRAMERELPAMQIANAYVSLYADAACTELVPFFCIRDGEPVRLPAEPFPAARLFPPSMPAGERARRAFVLPLTFESERLGVAVLEFGDEVTVFQMLREQISAALKTTTLHAEIVQRTALAERSVQERAATAKRMHSLSVLAGGVAHDLNNALGPLVALPDVILQELEDGASDASDYGAVRADVETIKAAALRAAQTIKDLLTLGREGRSTKELLDLNHAVTACLALDPLRGAAGESKRIHLDSQLSEEPLGVDASEAHLVRAVSNLLWNAADAIQSSGTVTVRTHPLRLVEPLSGYELIEPGEYSVVSVADDGRGIPEADILRIFEPFFTKKRLSDRSGSGLGLAIVHGVVKEHDGFLNVESKLGVGTRFSLYFPRRHQLAARRGSARPADAGRGRVLVVDDEAIQLRTARRVLARAGFEVSTADSAALALEQCRTTLEAGAPFDVVVLDMLLGDQGDGLDLFEEIDAMIPGVRAIIASGHAPSARGESAVDRGLAWLAKPYSADALIRAVNTAVDDDPKSTRVRRRVG